MTSPSISNLPLTALRAFCAAADQNSFAKAAVVLDVTPAAISQQIKRLESYLGCKLFVRENRTVTLTIIGTGLHHHVQLGLSFLESAVQRCYKIGMPPE